MNLSRLTKASVLEVLYEDYVRTAWAKGLNSRSVVVVHSAAERPDPGRHRRRTGVRPAARARSYVESVHLAGARYADADLDQQPRLRDRAGWIAAAGVGVHHRHLATDIGTASSTRASGSPAEGAAERQWLPLPRPPVQAALAAPAVPITRHTRTAHSRSALTQALVRTLHNPMGLFGPASWHCWSSVPWLRRS